MLEAERRDPICDYMLSSSNMVGDQQKSAPCIMMANNMVSII